MPAKLDIIKHLEVFRMIEGFEGRKSENGQRNEM